MSLLIRRPRDSQPQEAVGVDDAQAISLLNFSQGAFDTKLGELWGQQGSPTPLSPTRGGVGTYCFGGSASASLPRVAIASDRLAGLFGSGNPTALVYTAYFTGVTTRGDLFGCGRPSASKARFIANAYAGGTNNFEFAAHNGAFTTVTWSGAGFTSTPGVITYVLAWDGVGTLWLSRNGVDFGSKAFSASAFPNAAGETTTIGAVNASGANVNFWGANQVALLFAAIPAFLPPDKRRAISANPWQLLAPRRIWVPVSAAGGGGTTITASVGEASATGVTAGLNSTVNAGPAAASATGVTALLNTAIVAGPGVASATGVTARLNTSVNGTPAEASATGVTASIALAGTTTISAAPGEASAAGVSTHVDIALNAAPATATATGVSVTLPRAIGTTPGEAAAEGLTAQLNRIFGVTVADAIAAGVTALVNNASATVGRPASDTSNSGWSASTGSDLYAMVDEVTPSATDYIVATSVGAVCELALNGTGYPGTASQVLKFRASSSTGNSVIVRLKNTGGATVRSATQLLTAVDTEYSITLTAPEIAAITSGNLSVELESA